MRIVICGSIAFIDEMLEAKQELEGIPELSYKEEILGMKPVLINDFKEIV